MLQRLIAPLEHAHLFRLTGRRWGILSPSKQVETYLKLLVELVGGPNRKSKRARAITALAALVGAVSVARAKIRCMPVA